MITLNVPYSEKDEARQLGARWDAGLKKWYVPDGALATPLEKWMIGASFIEDAHAKAKLAGKSGARKAAKAPTRRSDSAGGRITVGVNYKSVEGATGLPWD